MKCHGLPIEISTQKHEDRGYLQVSKYVVYGVVGDMTKLRPPITYYRNLQQDTILLPLKIEVQTGRFHN